MAQKKTPKPDSAFLLRLRAAFERNEGVEEKRMFGGSCFLVGGNMVCGVTGDDLLMVRVGPDAYDKFLSFPHTREMDFTKRPMKGFLYIDAPGVAADDDLTAWVDRGLTFVRTLPPKKPKKR